MVLNPVSKLGGGGERKKSVIQILDAKQFAITFLSLLFPLGNDWYKKKNIPFLQSEEDFEADKKLQEEIRTASKEKNKAEYNPVKEKVDAMNRSNRYSGEIFFPLPPFFFCIDPSIKHFEVHCHERALCFKSTFDFMLHAFGHTYLTQLHRVRKAILFVLIFCS